MSHPCSVSGPHGHLGDGWGQERAASLVIRIAVFRMSVICGRVVRAVVVGRDGGGRVVEQRQQQSFQLLPLAEVGDRAGAGVGNAAAPFILVLTERLSPQMQGKEMVTI